MTKPAETDLLGDPQDSVDPQQVTYALLSIAQAFCLGEISVTFSKHSTLFLRLCYLQSLFTISSKNVSCLVLCGQAVLKRFTRRSPLRICMPVTH